MSEDDKKHDFVSIPTNPIRRRRHDSGFEPVSAIGPIGKTVKQTARTSPWRYALLMIIVAAAVFAVSLLIFRRDAGSTAKKAVADTVQTDTAAHKTRSVIKGSDEMPVWVDQALIRKDNIK